MTKHEPVLHKDLNNSESRYKNSCNFLTGDAYTPYTPCMSMPLTASTLYASSWKNQFHSVKAQTQTLD